MLKHLNIYGFPGFKSLIGFIVINVNELPSKDFQSKF